MELVTASMRMLIKTPTFPWKVFRRFILVQTLFVLVALGLAWISISFLSERHSIDQAKQWVLENLRVLGKASGPFDESYCKKLSDHRLAFTLIRSDGFLVCDSTFPKSQHSNQLYSQEVQEALKSEKGEGSRLLEEDGHEFLLVAKRISPEQILRVTIPLDIFSGSTNFWFIFLAMAGAFLVFIFWWAKQLLSPLGRLLSKTKIILKEGQASEDLSKESYAEWEELDSTIDHIRKDLATKTERLSKERAELETIIGSISEAILAVDTEGRPLFYNNRLKLVLGDREPALEKGRLWLFFRDPDVLNAFDKALTEGNSLVTRAIPIEQKGGKTGYYSLSVSPLRRRTGEVYGAVGVFRNVTELKTAEQMRIDFVANASHELKTPLTVIKGYLETMDSGLDSSALDAIKRNTDRLSSLVNDLLDLSFIESVDLFQKKKVSTKEITESVLNSLKGSLDSRNRVVQCEYLVPRVYADPDRLEQVLVNLIDNANKYSKTGGKIFLRWESDERDVLLKVMDEGPAVGPEHHGRLFERFYRADKARTRDRGGTGLGLSIVKHIVERHQGSVWIETNSLGGNTFFCRFP